MVLTGTMLSRLPARERVDAAVLSVQRDGHLLAGVADPASLTQRGLLDSGLGVMTTGGVHGARVTVGISLVEHRLAEHLDRVALQEGNSAR